MKVLQFTIPVAHDKSVIVQQDTIPYFYPYLHRHKEAQVTWIQEGEGTLIAGNNMHAFRSGEIYLLGPDQPHLFKSSPDYFQPGSNRGVRTLTVFFNPEGKLQPLFELPEMRSLKDFLQRYRQGFRLPDAYAERVSEIMTRIQNTTGPEEIVHFLQLLNILQSIQPAPEPLSAPGISKGITESEGIRISNIYNFILQHYSESLTLDDVAREACMTPQAFCRYFKKHTRQTFVSFLNQMRINEACKKLTGNKYESISVVAYKCGFSSITNFNRVFKSVMGHSPRVYMDKYMGVRD
jgi:AraC-like DNA-binding protein